MDTDEKELPYTVFEKVPGKPQLLKMAPVYVVEVVDTTPPREHPLAGAPQAQYPLGK